MPIVNVKKFEAIEAGILKKKELRKDGRAAKEGDCITKGDKKTEALSTPRTNQHGCARRQSEVFHCW
jgi:hypothetical protein